MRQLLESLQRRLKLELQHRTEQVSGGLKTFEEYREVVGRIRQTKDLAAIVDEEFRKFTEGDDA